MSTVALIPAYRSEATVAATVRAVAGIPGVGEVVVVDDASPDGTGRAALSAGARVLTMTRNRGKGRALQAAVDMGALGGASFVLMVDADTAGSAAATAALLERVVAGEADMAVGVLPPAGAAGGFGTVRKAASSFIRATSGYASLAPMSGQRSFTRELLEDCLPLAGRYAVDAALTADAVRRGYRVVEIPVEMTHDHRGRGAGGFAHRARQGKDILVAFLPRLLRIR